MKKLFISEEPQDAAFLEWGRKKLAQLKKLGNKVSKTYFVDPDVMVRVRSQPDEVLVRRVSTLGFVGYGKNVLLRSFGRLVSLSSSLFQQVGLPTITYQLGGATTSATITGAGQTAVISGTISYAVEGDYQVITYSRYMVNAGVLTTGVTRGLMIWPGGSTFEGTSTPITESAEYQGILYSASSAVLRTEPSDASRRDGRYAARGSDLLRDVRQPGENKRPRLSNLVRRRQCAALQRERAERVHPQRRHVVHRPA
jgi:hypothetical protein